MKEEKRGEEETPTTKAGISATNGHLGPPQNY
jgi:hypothetical protein